MLLVDAGGGNGILQQLEKAGIRLGDIHDMFITHAHTDHILGAVWDLQHLRPRQEHQSPIRHLPHDPAQEIFRMYREDRTHE